MKFGLVTKLDKRNAKTPNIFDNDVMPENRDVIFQFMVNLEQFGRFLMHGL